jgi:hypothetical protein
VARHAFISYSRSDGAYVQALAAHLRANGVEVWLDDGIDVGSRWVDVIRGQVDTCAAFVLVMSPESERSTWVAREVERAEARNRPILPLLLAGQPFETLRSLQYETVTHAAMPSDRFVARLRTLTAPPAPRADLGPPLGAFASALTTLAPARRWQRPRPRPLASWQTAYLWLVLAGVVAEVGLLAIEFDRFWASTARTPIVYALLIAAGWAIITLARHTFTHTRAVAMGAILLYVPSVLYQETSLAGLAVGAAFLTFGIGVIRLCSPVFFGKAAR